MCAECARPKSSAERCGGRCALGRCITLSAQQASSSWQNWWAPAEEQVHSAHALTVERFVPGQRRSSRCGVGSFWQALVWYWQPVCDSLQEIPERIYASKKRE
jgi:hypothetical protein